MAYWQYTVLNAYYYELQRQHQYDHHAVPRAQLNSIFAHLKASTKALQRIKVLSVKDMTHMHFCSLTVVLRQPVKHIVGQLLFYFAKMGRTKHTFV